MRINQKHTQLHCQELMLESYLQFSSIPMKQSEIVKLRTAEPSATAGRLISWCPFHWLLLSNRFQLCLWHFSLEVFAHFNGSTKGARDDPALFVVNTEAGSRKDWTFA